jgi:mRNA interferase MazF
MVETIQTPLSLPKTLCEQAEVLAQQLNISQSQLFGIAIEHFIRNHHNQALLGETQKPDLDEQSQASCQDTRPEAPIDEGQMVINQGDIYWVQIEDLSGSEPGIPHPHIVIQANILNHSRISTIVACALTSNRKRASTPGNVLLEIGEANLQKQSVVEVSKVSTVAKNQLGGYIGSLTEQRIEQILAGMRFLQRSFFAR